MGPFKTFHHSVVLRFAFLLNRTGHVGNILADYDSQPG